MVKIKTYGRAVLYANITEKDLLALDVANQDSKIIEIMNNTIGLHEANKIECQYLIDYKNGKQDIYTDKVKHTREEINNHTVENWAYACIDFKKCFLLAKPIQYTSIHDDNTDEISILNKYCGYEQKKTKDMDIYEDILTCGRGFRYTNTDIKQEEDEAPFELINPEVENTEVVYSSGIRHEQLFTFIETPMQYIETVKVESGELEELTRYYSEYTVYLRNRTFTLSNKTGNLIKVEGSDKPIILNEHLITEYYTNRKRISLIEIAKDLFNDINYLESLDKDDMEQFVNAIMVFTNAEVNENDLQEIKDLGAVSISSTENKQASVELLQQRLNAQDTQTYYTRLLTSLHQILGIPMASDNGSVTSGDTGKAKLTGQGYTTAGIRIEGDQNMFEMCDRKCLNTILKICKSVSTSEIKDLLTSDVQINFCRERDDNLLVKTQGLLNLYSCDIPREVANTVVNLFNDPNAVTKKQEELFGEQVANNKVNQGNVETTNPKDKVSEQNNNLINAIQGDVQGQ